MSKNALHFQQNHTRFTVRAAALIISNDCLLVAKSDFHDCFYTVGGVVNAGETSAAAVQREVLEETGVRMEIDRLVFIQERFFLYSGNPHHEITFFYLMKESDCVIRNGTQTDQVQEHLHWIPLETLPQTNLVPAFLKTTLANIPSAVTHILSEE